MEDLRKNYEKEKATLEEMEPTPVETPEVNEAQREWSALEEELLLSMEELDLGEEEDEETETFSEEDTGEM